MSSTCRLSVRRFREARAPGLPQQMAVLAARRRGLLRNLQGTLPGALPRTRRPIIALRSSRIPLLPRNSSGTDLTVSDHPDRNMNTAYLV